MKRPYRITLWVLGAAVILLASAIGAVSAILFDSRNLSSIVISRLNRQERYVFSMESADLVLFRTFPELSLHLAGFTMTDNVSKDTLATVPDLFAAIDIKAFLQAGELVIRKISLDNVYTDIDRLLAAFPSDAGNETAEVPAEELQEKPFSLPFDLIDISSVSISNLHAVYGNQASNGLRAEIQGLDMYLRLSTSGNSGEGSIKLDLPRAYVSIGDTVYCSQLPLYAEIPFKADLDSMKVELEDALMTIAGQKLILDGTAAMPASDTASPIDMDLTLKLDQWNIEEVMVWIPASFRHLTEDISAVGSVTINASAYGRFSSAEMPIVNGHINMGNVSAQADFLPMELDAAEAEIEFYADLDNNAANVQILSFSANSSGAAASAEGIVSDILNDPAFDLDLNLRADIEELLATVGYMLPDSLNVCAEGNAGLAANVSGKLSDITDGKYDRLTAIADMDILNPEIIYNDSIGAKSPEFHIHLSLNDKSRKSSSNVLDVPELADTRISATLSFPSLDILMGESMQGNIAGSDFNIGIADLPLGDTPLALYCDFSIGGIKAHMDTISVDITSPQGAVAMLPSSDVGKQGRYLCRLSGNTFSARMGSELALYTDSLSLGISAERDTAAGNILSQWSPGLDMDFKGAKVNIPSLKDMIEIPSIRLAFENDSIRLYESSVALGNSDFNLSGIISEISGYLDNSKLLTANLDFVSSNADVDQLLAYVSGFGSSDNGSAEASGADVITPADTIPDEGSPFMVPLGVDVTLNTKIDKALAFGNSINNVGGEITVKDGTAIIRQLGFTSDAAKMQLTAMYKSPRKNHLFAGLDFHLVDIQIDKLIQMIPQVDSIVPMLKSFSGQAEFHLGVETNLNSRYELKKSTLLGAATIEGRNLVVLDSETFDRIADLLMFKKSQKNMIDSLMVDVTVFRNEVDIYPFLLSIDNYKLILSGRHNLDMSFNYHLDCLSPVRLGVDVKGRIGDLKIGLSPTRYKDLFVPERRNDMQERIIKLMELINDSLKEGVEL